MPLYKRSLHRKSDLGEIYAMFPALSTVQRVETIR